MQDYLIVGNYQGFSDILGKVGETDDNMMEAAKPPMLPLYSQEQSTS